MNTKGNEGRTNTPNEKDERYATGNTSSSRTERTSASQGGYREWADHWDETKAKLQQNYSQLTDNDLRFESGKEDELVTRLSQKLGRTPEDTRKLLNDTATPATGARKEPRAEDRSSSQRDQDRLK